MWIFSRAGFFSAVKKGTGAQEEMCVRARVRADLERLRDLYYPEMGAIQAGQGTDYPYRVYMSREAWAQTAERMAQDVDYKNFKGMISGERGYAVADLYSDVWAVMYGAEKKIVPQRPPIPVDYAARHAPSFEEWRVEAGVEARERAAEENDRIDEAEAKKLRMVYSDTSDPIEAFQRKYEAAQHDIAAKRRAAKTAKKVQAVQKDGPVASPPTPKRGANGRFASKGE